MNQEDHTEIHFNRTMLSVDDATPLPPISQYEKEVLTLLWQIREEIRKNTAQLKLMQMS